MKNRIVRFPGVSPVPSPASNSSDVNSPILSKSVAETPSPRPKLHGVRNWRILCAVLIALVTAGLSSCHSASYYYYKFPADTYAGRPIPPSKLAQRVMIGVTLNGGLGNLQIVDALRDIRNNVENTIPFYTISGYSSGLPDTIFNFPSELGGYVYSSSDGSLKRIDYSTETSPSTVGNFQPGQNTVAIPPTFTRFYGAESSAGLLEVIDNQTGGSYPLSIPNVDKVVVNKGDTIALAMVRNSNALYRVFMLNQNQYPTQQAAMVATGSIDCEPALVPVYCAVPVPGTYDRPNNVYFSLDGTTAYVLNCGPECGGTTASVTLLQQTPLNVQQIPTSPVQPNPMIANVPVPGGVTAAISDGTTLYLAGQQLQPDGLFAGRLSTMNQATNTITHQYSISDGRHSKMLFADNNTLWIGSQSCANGERQKQFAAGVTGQAANYNCLTMVSLSASTLAPQVVPAVTQSATGVAAVHVPYPNQNADPYYYGSLTGLCWVQSLNKIYTAYGGQVHIFKTTDGSEIDNQYVAVQGTALDVAYMDAATDDAD
ncbi:MAG TPA: hypothetical protein VGU46_13100 [Acidobacteriaceae bacterium]|nr:hypothetical protein [Acidobacteriaceae bacterium]